MRIDPKAEICGFPALEIRRFLRATRRCSINASAARKILDISQKQAGELLVRLQQQGLVERKVATTVTGETEVSWMNSIAGNAMSMATAATPIKRSSAERIIRQFLDRVRTVNASDHLAMKVARVTVFGSYLSNSKTLNDIDLLVHLVARMIDQDAQSKLEHERRLSAVANGRRFGNITDEIGWPDVEVMLMLKNRQRSLSLHYSQRDHEFVAGLPHKVIFQQW